MDTPVVHSEDYRGLTIKVYPDEMPFDPREESDANLGTMLCWHPDYTLGDEQFSGPEDVGGARTMQDVARWLFRQRKATILLPLYLYDHSGITMRSGEPIYRRSPKDDAIRSTDRFIGDSAGWDTSMVGYIYTTAERVAELGVPKGDEARQLAGEVDEYDNFLTGNVYGFVIEDADGDAVDSCWGFFPGEDGMPWDYAVAEARATVDSMPGVARREQTSALVAAGVGL